MGYIRKRSNRHGAMRYYAMIEISPRRWRSVGSYDSARRAEEAWREAERKIGIGEYIDPRKSKVTFGEYAQNTWLPNRAVKAKTLHEYGLVITSCLVPAFGQVPLRNLSSELIRTWITRMVQAGLAPATISTRKTILAANLQTAVDDGYLAHNTARRVKTPPPPPTRLNIITVEEFFKILDGMPTGTGRLMTMVEMETGARWGELSELRPKDLEVTASGRFLLLRRAVADVHGPTGRFLVEDSTKGNTDRSVSISADLLADLNSYIAHHEIGHDDLLFQLRIIAAELASMATSKPPTLEDMPRDLAPFGPNAAGRSGSHGTTTGYAVGCRCSWCRLAVAQYRAASRAAAGAYVEAPLGSDMRANKTGHIPNEWFRSTHWLVAVKAAKLDRHVRFHDLRHAHASWAVADGHDLVKVKERLGHKSILTTQRYLHAQQHDTTVTDSMAARLRRP